LAFDNFELHYLLEATSEEGTAISSTFSARD